MKFSSEDLMKAMGLSVGDRIILDNGSVYEIKKRDSEILLYYLDGPRVKNLSMHFKMLSLEYLYEKNFEILPRPKRVGDLKCQEMNCKICPIRIICLEERHISNSLYFNLELYKKDQHTNFDQEIYDLLKARLDKEVE